MTNTPRMTRSLLAAIAVAAALVAAPVAGPAAAAEQSCRAAIQGKVAWNRAGDKNWEPGNLRRLCESTTLVDATIECFGNEIRSHDDWDGAIRTCTEARHEVEVVYVVPRDKRARPNIEKALAAIMAVTQRHFYEQLGVTFKLKAPLVQVVHIAEASEDIKKAETMSERCNKLANNRLKADFMYKENVVLCFFEADSGAGMGGGNTVSFPIWIWGEAYEQYHKDPSADLSKIHNMGAVSHELGHAFGLDHTEEAKPCFKKYGVDLGPLPNLIMQKKDDDYLRMYQMTFLPQEKRLLLDPNYLPECRALLNGRPHASWHLRHPLPRDNPTLARSIAPPNGRDVKMVRHADGAFRMIGPKQWVEQNGKGEAVFNFAEVSRDDASLVLFDQQRNFRVRLDLKHWQILLAVGPSPFSKLYPITDAS